MGLFNSLFGKTGAGKMAAALNALTAKHMMSGFDQSEIQVFLDAMHVMLMKNGMPDMSARETIRRTIDNEPEFCSISAMLFMEMNLPPIFPKCFPGGRWNFISNPLIALRGDEDEIRLARIDIFRRYQIDVNFDA